MINSFNKTDDFIKMINSFNKTDDFLKLINSLSKTDDFIKNNKFVKKELESVFSKKKSISAGLQ